MARDLASFVVGTTAADLPAATRQALQVRLLDSLGCALGALDGGPVLATRRLIDQLGGHPVCTLIGGGRSAPDRAAFYNGVLVRYLDFNDSYLAKGETCHPSDNLAAVLAACQLARATGRELITALGIAYQVQCRLSDVAPVRDRGFDHPTQGTFAAACGVAKALRLNLEQTQNAIAIAGTASNPLRVTRTGRLSNWKAFAAPHAGLTAMLAALLARRGISGPEEVFEGNKGFMDAIAGRFSIDWSAESFDRIERTILKRFNAEIHSQAAVEAILELRQAGLHADEVQEIEIDIFDVAYKIIGGGEEGDKTRVRTKEQADHSLPYMVAVALLDGQLGPEQYAPERILASDVQHLLRQVIVRPDESLSRRFPAEHACRIRVMLRDGSVRTHQKRDYEGFHTRPMRWETVRAKFERLAARWLEPELRTHVIQAVVDIEDIEVAELGDLLAAAHRPEVRPPTEARQ